MFKFLKGLAVLAAVVSTIGSASAASLYDVDITFSNSDGFTLSSLSLAPSADPLNNVLGSFSAGPYSGSGTILDEVVSLVTGTSYSFSFTGSTTASATAFSGNATIFAQTVPTSTNTTLNGLFTINVASALSPVPLPAGFPLFAMGLIALGAFGYHSLRSRKNGELTAAV
jgi:hypothetical protein